jgi:GTP-binding protein
VSLSPDFSPVPLPLTLAATAFTREQLIHPETSQAALAGRSNVGKSSLINALAGRKALAKVSAVPGKTRSINYYQLGPAMCFLVDLPGYGYARCSRGNAHPGQRFWISIFGTLRA